MNIKTLLKLGIHYAPGFLKRRMREKQQSFELARAVRIAKRTKVSREEFSSALSQFSFDRDIMLHTSMVNIGKIVGGARYVAKSIVEAVDTTKNTIVVSALPYRGSFSEWLTEDMIFNVRTAPVAMGAVNELIADFDGALRSAHPTHSVVAIGPDAEFYVGEHHLCQTPFDLQSPYYKLIKKHAKVLLVGATINNITFIHAIEDMLGDAFPVKVYSKRRYNIKCVNEHGNTFVVNTPVHAPFAGIIRNMQITDGLVPMHKVPIGESEITMFDCYDYTMAYLDLLANGQSIYGRHKVSSTLLKRIGEVKNSLNQS